MKACVLGRLGCTCLIFCCERRERSYISRPRFDRLQVQPQKHSTRPAGLGELKRHLPFGASAAEAVPVDLTSPFVVGQEVVAPSAAAQKHNQSWTSSANVLPPELF
jgi:hypothetical protein